MSSGLPGFGGQGYVTQESRALSTISESPGADLSQGQEAAIKMLQTHDSQIKFLASQMKQAQKGINDANQNPIQQIEQFIADIIILLGGGELATGALDFGDLQYILPALGALFGFGDGPFPISLFEAAEKFFLGYVVPGGQFVDVINGIIQAWLGTLGIDPKFIKDIKALVTAFGDLFDGLSNLLPSLNELFNALGISGGDLGPFGQALSPIMKLFTDLDITKFGNMIEFITDAIDPFIVELTAIINWIDSILAIFGFSGSGGVVNSPLGDTTNPFTNLLGFLGGVDFNASGFNPITAAVTFITNSLSPTGLLAQLFGGFLSVLNIPGLDGSKITTGSIGDGLLPIINNLLAGLTGVVPTGTGTSTAVGSAAASQTDVLTTISAAVAKLEAQLADLDPATILVEDAFEYTNTTGPDSSNWDVYEFTKTTGGITADGHVEADGHQIVWHEDGSGNHGKRFLFKGTDAASTHDDMTVKFVIGSNAMPGGAGSFLGLLGRAKSDMSEFLEIRMFDTTLQLWWCTSATGSVGGGTETQVGTTQTMSGAAGAGAIVTLDCGTVSGHRYFVITVNSQQFTIFDGASVTAVDSSHRHRGFTMFSGQVVFFGATFQKPTAPIAHWASQNAA